MAALRIVYAQPRGDQLELVLDPKLGPKRRARIAELRPDSNGHLTRLVPIPLGADAKQLRALARDEARKVKAEVGRLVRNTRPVEQDGPLIEDEEV
jgi:hypothetical protein